MLTLPRRDTRPSYSTPHDYYWALASPEDIVGHLQARRDAFFRFVEGSSFFRRVLRLWQYVHGMYHDNADVADMEIQIAGEEGEQYLIAINHLRSIIHLLVTYTTQNRPAWDTMATNADARALRQTRLGNQLLDHYMETGGVEQMTRRAVEHAYVLLSGYVRVIWDETMGRELNANPRTDEMTGEIIGGEVYREGDVFYDNPTIFDVVTDFTRRTWEDNQWAMARKQVNQWDMVAIYPDYEEEILKSAQSQSVLETADRVGTVYLQSDVHSDLVDYWEFYHKPTPALPNGRKVCFVGDQILKDEDWSYDLPIHRMVVAELLLTCLGYSPGLDMLGGQEALNMLFSNIVTNSNNFGQQKVWFRSGSAINLADLDAGCSIVQSKEAPQPLNLMAPPGNMVALVELFKTQLELVSGVNSVARGQPEASLRSGDALAIIDAKAIQFASQAVANYYHLLTSVGTATLKLLQRNATTERVAAVAGVNQRSSLKKFQSTDLDQIDLVRVIPGNPILRTLAGREYVASKLMASSLVTKEEFFTVLTTGELRPLTRFMEAQLDTIHEENELLLEPQFDPAVIPQGLPPEMMLEWVKANVKLPEPLIHDDHALHITEHTSLLDSTEMRTHPVLAPQILSHIKNHMELMFTPAAQQFALLFGYRPPISPLGMAPGPGGAPPKPRGTPGGEPEPSGATGTPSKSEAKARAMSGTGQEGIAK